MEAFTLILLLLAAVLVSSVLDQLVPRVSAPLIQIALGFIIAMLAVTPFHFSVDPDLFLVLFIAPLLFDEAKRADKGSLWKNKRSIASLAIGLVLAIVLAVGFVTNALIPSIPLAAAFALGAALGPTDAVAVSAMKKEIQLTERQEALLGGESLINDASGIVSFQYAIAAVTTGAFSVLDAGVTFVEEFLGGILLGLALGAALTWLMRKIRSLGLDNNTFHVLFEVFTPFIIFLFGDAIHVSGILAVVAAGLVISFTPRRIGPVQSHYSIVSSSVWRVLAYTLNGIVFVLLGMQLPLAMTSTWVDHSISNEWLLMTVAVLTVVLTLVRFAWVLCMELLHHDRVTGHRPKLSAALVRDVAVTTLAGPKGAITLSIAFTIPVFLSSSGDYFPQRDVIIFLASGVIVCTLLLANFVVPLIAPKRAVDTQAAERVALVNIEILRTVIEELTRQQTLENKAATRAVIRSYNARIARLQQSNDLDTEPREALRIKIIRAPAEPCAAPHRGERPRPGHRLPVHPASGPDAELHQAPYRQQLARPKRAAPSAHHAERAVAQPARESPGRQHDRALRRHPRAHRGGRADRRRPLARRDGAAPFQGRDHRLAARRAREHPPHAQDLESEPEHHHHRARHRQGGRHRARGPEHGARAHPRRLRGGAPYAR